jgi:hypothetical protein
MKTINNGDFFTSHSPCRAGLDDNRTYPTTSIYKIRPDNISGVAVLGRIGARHSFGFSWETL